MQLTKLPPILIIHNLVAMRYRDLGNKSRWINGAFWGLCLLTMLLPAKVMAIQINDLPRQINSREEFESVLDLKAFLQKDLMEDGCFYENLLPVIEEADKWSKSHGEIQDVLSGKLLKLMLFDKLRWQEQTLSLGKQLLEYEEFYAPIDVNHITGILYNNYRQLEAYHEIIRLIPLLEKYRHLENGWRFKGYTAEYDIAMINYRSGNYNEAINGFIHQLQIFQSLGNQLMVSSMYNNVGLCYYHLSDYENSRENYHKALVALEKPNNEGVEERSPEYKKCFEMVIWGNLADIDFDQGQYEKALQAYLYEQVICQFLGGYPRRTSALYNLSKTYLALNKPELAELYIDSTLASINSYVSTEKEIESYELKAKIVLYNGRIDKSMHYFRKAHQLSDSIKRLHLERDNLVAKVSYESTKKDEDLLQMKEALKIKEKEASKQWAILVFLLIVFAIIGGLYIKSRKDQHTIERQREHLQASVQEKELLLKEVHHRVKNNLQVISGLLKIQSKKVQDKAMLELLDDSQNYISNIASVHEMLYQQEDGSTVHMEDYLDKISEQMLDTCAGSNIAVMVSASQVYLSINKAIPIGLMTSELLTNAMKHAFKNIQGTVRLSMEQLRANGYLFKYSDDGPGLPVGFEENSGKTMGFRLMSMLAEEMEGKLEIVGESGLVVKVYFADQ